MEEFLRVSYKIVSFLGFLLLLGVISLLIIDYLDIDKRVNFDRLDLTNTGMVKRGYLLDAHLNCTTGFVGLSIFKLRFYNKPLKNSLKTKWNAKEACKKRGFTPGETF